MNRLVIGIAAVAALAAVQPSQALTVRGTFTCNGILNHDASGYQIITPGVDYNIPTCELDDADKLSTNKILSVCHEDGGCLVRATGWIGNGNRRLIEKVLSVRSLTDSP